MNNTFKSIGAILAGMMVIVILSIATDTLLETLGIFPSRDIPYPSWMLGLALLYRTAYAVFGGFITAAAAPSKPMRHAIILGIIGIVLSTAGAVANLGKSDNWYPVALVLTALPGTWLGSRIQGPKQNLSKNI